MIARVMLLLVALVSAGAQAQEIKESYGATLSPYSANRKLRFRRTRQT
ncbi:hypothetical protein SeGA_3187 [Salmonella enterica subsp. enterica serovar Gaminara str. A4-567]|nr:hypothetical protein SeGA_3187 [Salmonella enterica subsp. enterica serovar Gaminara str. A4-567]